MAWGYRSTAEDDGIGGDNSQPQDYSGSKDYSEAKDYSGAQNHSTASTLNSAEQKAGGDTRNGSDGRDIGKQENAGYDSSRLKDLDERLANLTKRSQTKQGRFAVRHKKALVGGLIALLTGGSTFFMFTIISGPMQLVHAMHFIKDVKMFLTDAQTAARYLHNMPSIQRLLDPNARNSIAGSVRNSRLGITGNAMADRLMGSATYNANGTIRNAGGRLTRRGVTFDSGVLGSDRGMTIDPAKLTNNERFSLVDRDGKPTRNADRWVEQQTGLKPGEYDIGRDGKIKISEKTLSRGAEKRLIYKLDNIGRFNIIGKLQTRLALTKIGKLGMFHPIKKAEQKAIKKLEDFIEKTAGKIAGREANLSAAEKNEAKKRGEYDYASRPENNYRKVGNEWYDSRGNPLSEEAKKAMREAGEEAVKLAERGLVESVTEVAERGAKRTMTKVMNKVANVASKIAVPLIILQVICMLNDLTNTAGSYKQENVVNVAMAGTAFVMGLGSQIMSGDDIDIQQVGYATEMTMGSNVDVVDEDGKPTGEKIFSSMWQAKPVYAEQGKVGGSDDDLPPALANVSRGGFAFFSDEVNNIMNSVFKFPVISGACWIFDKVDELMGAILQPFMDFVITPLMELTGADKLLTNLMNTINGFLYGDPLNLAKLLPVGWGFVLMYGGLFLSNEQARGNGAPSMSAVQMRQVITENREFIAWRDGQKPLLARLLDPADYNSTINQLARTVNLDTSNQNFTTQLGNVFKFFGAAPQLLGAAIGTGGSTNAYPIAGAYDYGVPMFGFSAAQLEMQRTPEFEIWANAETVYKMVDNKDPIIEKAKKCFGVEIGSAPDYKITQMSNESGEGIWNYADTFDGNNDADCGGSWGGTNDDTLTAEQTKMLHVSTYIEDYNSTLGGACYEGDDSDSDVGQACSYVGMESGNSDSGGGNTNFSSPEEVAAAFEKDTNNTGDWDGSYGRQCVDLSMWFVQTHTTLTWVGANGGDVVANLVAGNPGKITSSNVPKAPAIFSTRVSKYRANPSTWCSDINAVCGHTGLIITVNGNTLTGLDTWNGAGGVNTFTIEWAPGDQVDFAYLGDVLK